jgi:hypothetical protein
MMKIQESTNELFQRWKRQLEKDGFTGFCEDGLMYRGSYWEKDGQSGFAEGDEEELWINAPKRILFLLKDTNGNPNCDMREFHMTQRLLFNRNLAYWFYGLLAFDENNEAPGYRVAKERAFDTFHHKPLAIVNCKKDSGTSSISTEILQHHIDRYGHFIKEEIDILAPDIIVCGGGSSCIKNFVAEKIYPGVESINNWIFFDKASNKVIIDSYHPSYYQTEGGSETIYASMMNAYGEFLEKYPDFRKSCRTTSKDIEARSAKPLERKVNYLNNTSMGLFKKNALEIVSKELSAEFGKKLQTKNCEHTNGKKYIQFWFEPYDKWLEVWSEGDKLTLYLASSIKSGGFEVGGILFNKREWSNELKHHWYSSDRVEYEPKSEEELSALIADAVAVLNDLIKYRG